MLSDSKALEAKKLQKLKALKKNMTHPKF